MVHPPSPLHLFRGPPCVFETALGEDGKKFKTRSGETVKLSDLLMEAVRIAGESIRKRREEEGGEGYEASRGLVRAVCCLLWLFQHLPATHAADRESCLFVAAFFGRC